MAKSGVGRFGEVNRPLKKNIGVRSGGVKSEKPASPDDGKVRHQKTNAPSGIGKFANKIKQAFLNHGVQTGGFGVRIPGRPKKPGKHLSGGNK